MSKLQLNMGVKLDEESVPIWKTATSSSENVQLFEIEESHERELAEVRERMRELEEENTKRLKDLTVLKSKHQTSMETLNSQINNLRSQLLELSVNSQRSIDHIESMEYFLSNFLVVSSCWQKNQSESLNKQLVNSNPLV